MICVYCGEETGEPYDEHEECVDEALEEELSPSGPAKTIPATDPGGSTSGRMDE